MGSRAVVRQVSFLVVVAGVFLPWLVVAGRRRSGLRSAELLVSLADAGGPTSLRVLGILWYLGAFMVLAGWAGATLATTRRQRWAARWCVGLSLLAWLTFAVWAGRHDSILLQTAGPATGLTGCVGLLASENWRQPSPPRASGDPHAAGPDG